MINASLTYLNASDMELSAILIVAILALIGLISSIIKDKIEFVGISSFILGTLYMAAIHYTEIKPIEVYRGNTTLEITYEDGVAIDSVVVWKNK